VGGGVRDLLVRRRWGLPAVVDAGAFAAGAADGAACFVGKTMATRVPAENRQSTTGNDLIDARNRLEPKWLRSRKTQRNCESTCPEEVAAAADSAAMSLKILAIFAAAESTGPERFFCEKHPSRTLERTTWSRKEMAGFSPTLPKKASIAPKSSAASANCCVLRACTAHSWWSSHPQTLAEIVEEAGQSVPHLSQAL